MCSSLQCIHHCSLFIFAVCSSLQFVHPCSVFIIAVCSSLQCVHHCSLFILAVCSSLQCVHPCSLFIFAACSSLQCVHPCSSSKPRVSMAGKLHSQRFHADPWHHEEDKEKDAHMKARQIKVKQMTPYSSARYRSRWTIWQYMSSCHMI